MTTLTPRPAPADKRRRPLLERQAIWFTISLYLFICTALLVVHYAAPEPHKTSDPGSSSVSPYNP